MSTNIKCAIIFDKFISFLIFILGFILFMIENVFIKDESEARQILNEELYIWYNSLCDKRQYPFSKPPTVDRLLLYLHSIDEKKRDQLLRDIIGYMAFTYSEYKNITEFSANEELVYMLSLIDDDYIQKYKNSLNKLL